jgi:hypothetical protein
MADGTNKFYEELVWLIDNAEPHELIKHQADHLTKAERKGEHVAVRGTILDAMDADRISVREAMTLLRRCRQRLGQDGPGMSRVDADGELVAIGGK